MHNFLSPPSGGGYVSHREFRRRCCQIRVPPPLPLSSSSCNFLVFLLLTLCENLHSPPREMVQLAKICTGNLTGSGLRKYALRQNHTIPVYCGRRSRTHDQRACVSRSHTYLRRVRVTIGSPGARAAPAAGGTRAHAYGYVLHGRPVPGPCPDTLGRSDNKLES